MQMAVVESMEVDLLKKHSTTSEKDKSPITIASSKRRSTMEADLSGSSISNNTEQEELLKSAKAKMGEVKEENEKLRKLLAHIVEEYQALEKQVSSMTRSKKSPEKIDSTDEGNQETEMVSLSLGSWSSSKKIDDKKQTSSDTWNKRRKVDEGLDLGLDCTFQRNRTSSPSGSMKNSAQNNESNEEKGEKIIETWPPSRELKVKENTYPRERDEETLHQPQVKKTRVCIRSRCDSPTIHDGCQWRKYGQKIAKGNPCPRAYYRCTVSSNCPVRKQVQRCPHDMSILITTYEGTHNHPLPISATAMASATSAAASMIKTGSLTSQPTLSSAGPNTTASYGLHTSNLITTFNNNPSMITAASHNSHPTVTLDLTTANPDFSPFSWSFSSTSSSSTSSRNSSSFLNFSSSSSCSPSLDFSSSALPTSNNAWASGYLNYGTLFPYNSNTNNDNTRNIFQSLNSHQQSLNETIAAAATKAIASNPKFQSVLEAAISSYVGNKGSNNDPMKSTEGGGSLMLFPTSLPFSTSKSSPAAMDTRDHS